jgi:spore coat protein U-like protein
MTMKLTKLLLVLASAGLTVISSDSSVVAATATANLPVSVVVGNNCTITSTAVTFPNYDPIVTHATNPDDSTAGAVTVTCTKGTVANIGLGLGANANVNQRRMKDGGTNYINYELYQNVGRTTVWGNASGSWFTPTPAAAPDKNPRTFTVYGRIPGNQDVPAGTYNDTVVATVNF